MMEFTLDYASWAKKLEIQELESPGGRASPQVYGQLLAIYLLFNDLISAKFLWKRIPQEIKDANEELSIIWHVGKSMWRKDYAEIYGVIKSCPSWPNHLKNIMNLILDSTRRRAEKLIMRAYSTVHIAQASKLLGLTPDETCQWVAQQNWTFDNATGFITVTKDSNNESNKQTTIAVMENRSELIDKLTDYILFLESPVGMDKIPSVVRDAHMLPIQGNQ